MVESGYSRVWRTIPIILIVVLFCPIADSQVIYVDDDAAGANDGTNWENAYNYLQDALADADSAEKPVEIRVAQGIYKPDQGANQAPGSQWVAFELINGVTIKGSYAGLGHEDPNDRDVAGFTTNDLVGEWFLGGSDIQGNHTWDGLLMIDSEGAVTGGTLESSEGPVYTLTGGNLTIDETGKITGQVTYSDGIKFLLIMQMDKNKGIIAGEGNDKTSNEDGVFIFVKKSSGFMTSDLADEWFLCGSDIQGDHTWDGLLMINSDGIVTGGTLESSDGPLYTLVDGDLNIDATGKVTGQITDSNGVATQITMQMDKGKGIIAGEGNAEADNEDGLFIFVKKSTGFTTSDLEGRWSLGGSDIQGDHTWDGFLLIDGEGNITGGMIASSEGPAYTFIDGGLGINSTGKVTGSVTDSDGVTTQLTMQMDESKDIVAGEGNAQKDDEDGIFVFVRRSTRYKTILSGDLLGNDAVVDDPCDLLNEPNRAENSYHVVYGSEVDSSSILDGFTISDGNAPDRELTGYGGGIYLRSGSEPTVSNCTFSENSASYGGAIGTRYSSKPSIVNCIFYRNAARISGGAILNGDNCGAILTNCAFISNYTNYGGGALSSEQKCELVLMDCMFLRNRAGSGGAVDDYNANSTLYFHCSFIENFAERGGGVRAYSFSEMSFTDCRFIGNEADDVGGGFQAEHGPTSAVFTKCIFRANSASSGGGVCIFFGDTSFKDCKFIENSANFHREARLFANTHRGGGAYMNWTNASLNECDFVGNSSKENGGGLFIDNGSVPHTFQNLTNCKIVGNKAPNGGGVFCAIGDYDLTFVNCTISENRANYGAGIYCSVRPQIQNCVVWGNDIGGFSENVYKRTDISHSNVEGGWAGDGNIEADPLFVDPGYWDTNETLEDPNDDFWVNGDYRLTPCSPCIDRGDPNYISDPNETDLDGNLRVIGGRIDMGAYEYPFVYDKPDEGSPPGSWRKYSENPVFFAGGHGQWDNRINGSVTVLKDSEEPVNKYKMWYVGGNQFVEGAGIGYATSPDGINWIRNENNPVLEPGEPWNVDGFSGICVIKDGPNYKIWYEGVDSQSTARIGYATSPDGINWDINNSNPVFSPRAYDAWDNEDVGNPCVVKEGSTYKMWYWGDNILTGIDQIGLAVSNDGINWQRAGSEPVIAPDPGIWWQDGEGIGTPHVVRVNSGYVMAYHAADEIGTIRIGLATSSDGLDWKKENEPILYPGDENSWESTGIVTGSFIRDTLHLKLWYLGIDASETIKVGLAISCDDIVFDVEAEN